MSRIACYLPGAPTRADSPDSTSHPEARRMNPPSAPSSSTKDSPNDSARHSEAPMTSLPSAPSATSTEDLPDDSPSHPEAAVAPSGCSGYAKNSSLRARSIAQRELISVECAMSAAPDRLLKDSSSRLSAPCQQLQACAPTKKKPSG